MDRRRPALVLLADAGTGRAPREQTIIVTGEHDQPVERTFWTDTRIR
jgi:hypothetical protein